MYYALIYRELDQNLIDIFREERHTVYRLVQLKKLKIKPYIQYNVDEILINGKVVV